MIRLVFSVDQPRHHRPRRGPWLQMLTPTGFECNRVELPIGQLPAPLDGFRVLHLSDTHFRSRWHRAYDRLIARIIADPPDLICFTGDLVDNRWSPADALPVAERFARALPARPGVFAVIGNHDGDLLAQHVPRWGWHLLHPGVARMVVGGATLEIVGLPCVARNDLTQRVLRSIPRKANGAIRLLLSHYPDHVRHVDALEADVILTGHTHGGQVCLPTGTPIITHDALPRSMSSGVFRTGSSWLIIYRGFGFATYRIRLFAPAEVCEVVLRSPGHSVS